MVTGSFWGLVEQKGPWKSTSNDAARSHRSQPSKKTGGGIPIGGTENSGHAEWYAGIKPKVDPNVMPPPPGPSQYVQKSIVGPATMMPKAPKGRILRNTVVETIRPEPSGVQKPGQHYVPHFQPSGEEAPRVNEIPSLEQDVPDLMSDSDISSYTDSSYFSTSDYRDDPLYQQLQQTLNETIEPSLPETIPYIDEPTEVSFVEPVEIPFTEPTVMYPAITEQEMLADRKPKRKIKKKPTTKIDSEEFEKYVSDNRKRKGAEGYQYKRKPKIPLSEFQAHTYVERNRNRRGVQGDKLKRKGEPEPDETKVKQDPIKERIEELSTGVSLQVQIKELEKTVRLYERLKKKAPKKFGSDREKKLKHFKTRLTELIKKLE